MRKTLKMMNIFRKNKYKDKDYRNGKNSICWNEDN